jgi:hypothetical protein
MAFVPFSLSGAVSFLATCYFLLSDFYLLHTPFMLIPILNIILALPRFARMLCFVLFLTLQLNEPVLATTT